MKGASQEEIARLAGVSRSTVAWALSPKRRHKLKPETLARVQAAADRLQYRPHRYAQIMRRGRSGIIGALRFPGFSDFRAAMEVALLRQIRLSGYTPMLADATGVTDQARTSCDELLDARVEGVIIEGPGPHTKAVVERFRQAGIPVVIVCGTGVPGTVHVRSDMGVGMRAITAHLLGLGHRRLCQALVAPTDQIAVHDWWRIADRLRGFVEAVREAGGRIDARGRDAELMGVLGFDPGPAPGPGDIAGEVIFHESHASWPDPFETGLRFAARRLAEGPRPDALVCTNDDWAVGAIKACADAGLRVPEDIAVTGHDNIAVGAYLTPALTTACHPVDDNTGAAVRVLLDLIQGREPPSDDITYPTSLIVRRSCGASP